MTLRTRITLGLTLWLVCEAVAFSFVVEVAGLGAAILIGIVTSMIGASQLRRIGTAALGRLRRGAAPGGPGLLQGELALDDTLAAVGAVLLLLPGFVTDAIGLVLAAPVLRRWIAAWFQGGGFRTVRGKPHAQHGPTVIDLEPEEWRPVNEPRGQSVSKT